MTSKKLLITGGAGFIGSAVIRHIINNTNHSVINVDKLTYAGNLENLKSVQNNPNYEFVKGDIGDSNLVADLLKKYQVSELSCIAS